MGRCVRVHVCVCVEDVCVSVGVYVFTHNGMCESVYTPADMCACASVCISECTWECACTCTFERVPACAHVFAPISSGTRVHEPCPAHPAPSAPTAGLDTDVLFAE